MTREIQLTRGMVALVDDVDFERAVCFEWSAAKRGAQLWYAKRSASPRPHRSWEYLHRFILGVVDPSVRVDHKNNDGLDNRRLNLRVASHGQNCQNSRPRSSSGFKGVDWHSGDGRWRARCGGVHIGEFDSAEEAAVAYDRVALEVYGKDAFVNFGRRP